MCYIYILNTRMSSIKYTVSYSKCNMSVDEQRYCCVAFFLFSNHLYPSPTPRPSSTVRIMVDSVAPTMAPVVIDGPAAAPTTSAPITAIAMQSSVVT